jgi:dTDP-4-amino-4,6-dideoxygalactose transaminase
MALKALNITKEVITTPFSYVATTNAILWEGCTPIFVDIDKETFCIDASKIEAAITENTEAILATHVYGIPCDVIAIEKMALKYNLKVIYDGAHSFGAIYNNKSLLSYGDISTCSFHATKLFHTVEGGCVICNDADLAEKLFLFRSFGHRADDYFTIGINGKNSEFHAAMGLAIFPDLSKIIVERKDLFEFYARKFENTAVKMLNIDIKNFNWNYPYCPVLFENEQQLLKVRTALEQNGINIRRYFYPSLNQLPYLTNTNTCVVSEDYAKRVASLPLYPGLLFDQVEKIVSVIFENL